MHRAFPALTATLLAAAVPVGAQVHHWSRSFARQSGPGLCGVAVDPQGAVFLAGTLLDGSVDFGGGPLVPIGSGDVYVAKFDPAGRHLWSQAYGDAAQQSALGVAACPDGGVVVAGWFMGSLDFGGGPLVPGVSYTAFVTKLDRWGEEVWSHAYGGPVGAAMPYAVGVGPDGDVAVAGLCGGTLDFGGGPQTWNWGSFGLLLDSAGRFRTSAILDGFELEYPAAVATDARGNVYVCGETASYGAIPPACVSSVGEGAAGPSDRAGPGMPVLAEHQRYAFVLHLTPQGQMSWLRTSTGGCEAATRIALDRDGATFVVGGHFCYSFDLGGEWYPSRGARDVFVSKFDACGARIWSRTFGDAGDQLLWSVGVDPATGDILLAGTFRGSIDFGGGALTSAGDYDFFLARLDAGGGHVGSWRYGDPAQQYSVMLAPGGGGFALAGSFAGNLDLGGGPLPNVSGSDLFLARFVDDPTDVGDGDGRAVGLLGAWPNPASGSVHVDFALPGSGHVVIEVLDVRGRRVRTIFDGGRGPGSQVVTWDGYDALGARSPAGVYVVRLATGDTQYIRKVVRVDPARR